MDQTWVPSNSCFRHSTDLLINSYRYIADFEDEFVFLEPRYRRECHRLFQLQNRVLSSDDVIDSDHDEADSEDDNNDLQKISEEKCQEQPGKFTTHLSKIKFSIFL